MATKTTKRPPRATPRGGTKPAPKGTNKPAGDYGLSRAEIDRADAAGPGPVRALLPAAAKQGEATPPAQGQAVKTPAAPADAPTTKPTPRKRDPRLPAPGTSTVRTYKGKEHRVTYLEHGVEVDGTKFDSLSAAARHVTGAPSINGFLWFQLLGRSVRPAKVEAARPTPTTGKRAKQPDAPKIGHGNEIGTPAGQRAALATLGIAKRGRPITKPRDATASTKGATK